MARPLDSLIGLGLNPSPYDEAKREARALRDAIKDHNANWARRGDEYLIDISHIPETP